jgi:hypothetical protein
VFSIRVLCAPEEVGPVVYALAGAFVVRSVKQLPADDGGLERVYVEAERRAPEKRTARGRS